LAEFVKNASKCEFVKKRLPIDRIPDNMRLPHNRKLPIMTKRDAGNRIGIRLAELRKMRAISQAKLARAIGVTVGTIQAYEHGRARIAAERIVCLAEALQCEPAELLKPRKAL
jgi:DNA-binding XRE family transcriptional regulator